MPLSAYFIKILTEILLILAKIKLKKKFYNIVDRRRECFSPTLEDLGPIKCKGDVVLTFMKHFHH